MHRMQRLQPLPRHMRINLRRGNILVPQQILHRPDVIPVLQQMRRKRMPQRMATRRLRNPRQPRRHLHRPLQTRLLHMMPPQNYGRAELLLRLCECYFSMGKAAALPYQRKV